MSSTRTTRPKLAAALVSAALLGAAAAPAALAQPADPVGRTQATQPAPATPDATDRAQGYSPSLGTPAPAL